MLSSGFHLSRPSSFIRLSCEEFNWKIPPSVEPLLFFALYAFGLSPDSHCAMASARSASSGKVCRINPTMRSRVQYVLVSFSS